MATRQARVRYRKTPRMVAMRAEATVHGIGSGESPQHEERAYEFLLMGLRLFRGSSHVYAALAAAHSIRADCWLCAREGAQSWSMQAALVGASRSRIFRCRCGGGGFSGVATATRRRCAGDANLMRQNSSGRTATACRHPIPTRDTAHPQVLLSLLPSGAEAERAVDAGKAGCIWSIPRPETVAGPASVRSSRQAPPHHMQRPVAPSQLLIWPR